MKTSYGLLVVVLVVFVSLVELTPHTVTRITPPILVNPYNLSITTDGYYPRGSDPFVLINGLRYFPFDRDVFITFPSTTPIDDQITIAGGRNIRVTAPYIVMSANATYNAGIAFNNVVGSIFVEGAYMNMTQKRVDAIDLRVAPSTNVSIDNLDVIIYNSLFYGLHSLNNDTIHADIVQIQGGGIPHRIYMENVTGYTGYQVFFLPQRSTAGENLPIKGPLEVAKWKNVNLKGYVDPEGHSTRPLYFWFGDKPWNLTLYNVEFDNVFVEVPVFWNSYWPQSFTYPQPYNNVFMGVSADGNALVAVNGTGLAGWLGEIVRTNSSFADYVTRDQVGLNFRNYWTYGVVGASGSPSGSGSRASSATASRSSGSSASRTSVASGSVTASRSVGSSASVSPVLPSGGSSASASAGSVDSGSDSESGDGTPSTSGGAVGLKSFLSVIKN